MSLKDTQTEEKGTDKNGVEKRWHSLVLHWWVLAARKHDCVMFPSNAFSGAFRVRKPSPNPYTL